MQKVFSILSFFPSLISIIHAPTIQCNTWINKILCSKFNTCDVQLLNAFSYHYTDSLALAKYFFSNNKLPRNLEGGGDKGKEDLFCVKLMLLRSII